MEDFLYGVSIYIAGIVTAIISIWFLLTSEEIWLPLPSAHKKHVIPTDAKLPDAISDSIKNPETYRKRETCLSLNLILQFFFQEKQHDTEIRIWLTELISQELSDLLKHRALSKIINKMEIQDLNLGHNFPVIKAATPVNIQFLKNSTLLKKVEISVEIEYTGGFQLAIDAITKLSQKAVVKIKVVRLSGKGCLEFNRYPYTHWSFSFYEEPESEFEVVSTVLGRHIPRFKSIIINQLKLLINKKHTLPHYKLRGPPLINRRLISTDSACNLSSIKVDGAPEMPGFMYLTLIKCTRLQQALVGTDMYFSLTLCEIPLVCAYETPVGIWVTLDLTIKRTLSTPFGILLRTADDNSQIIETVSSKSLAYQAGLRKNDIVLAVNGVCLISGSQAARLLSSTSSDNFKNRAGSDSQEMVIRIKRLVYTDHKRSSMENKNLFESRRFLADTSSIFSLSSSQTVPVFIDDDISMESVSIYGDAAEKAKQSRPISIQGDKVTFSISNKDKLNTLDEPEGGTSVLSSSVSSCSSNSSPDLRSKLFNVSAPVTDLSPIHSCDEETSRILENAEKFPSGVSPGWENVSEHSSPIQIPYGMNKLVSNGQSQENQSVSAQSSRAGTPTSQTFEFVPLMIPPGMPIIKMDVKNVPKKVAGKNIIVLKHFETAPVEGSCEPILGNDFEFSIDEESKYVNICVWSKNLPLVPLEAGMSMPVSEKDDKTSSAKDVINKLRKKDSKEVFKESERSNSKNLNRQLNIDSHTVMTGHPDHILVGYANLVIEDIICEATLNTQGYVTKIVSLQPANTNCPELNEHPLLQHTGFDPKLCYGDAMLTITHQPKNKIRQSNKVVDKGITNVAVSEDESPTDATQSDDEDFEINQDRKEDRDHDFKRTHFNAATHCNFCKKKIWLKDAYQCSECGIICHKKCMLRCEQATVCDFGGLRYREIKDPLIKADGKLDLDMPEIITTSAVDFPVFKRSKKSPPVTPQVSLSGNPFLSDNDSNESRLETTLDVLLNYPHDERLLSMAKESAVHLYPYLPPQERLDKIKQELDILQHRVDNEGETRKDLAIQEKTTSDKNDPLKKMKLSLLISECDARTQALALLTLHYFTAFQQAQEACRETSEPVQA